MAERAALRIWRGAVLDEWIDYNGHMTEGFYGVVFGMASDEYLTRMGFDEHYRATTGGSFYTVETHITFIDELAPGNATGGGHHGRRSRPQTGPPLPRAPQAHR